MMKISGGFNKSMLLNARGSKKDILLVTIYYVESEFLLKVKRLAGTFRKVTVEPQAGLRQ